ncbi:SGT1 protein-domain-containing protein [Mucidula mucida]|nr:SGT1 protein-domain-containing protein [Mucidula mucida]
MTSTTNVFNRPPNISEDTLQYALYAPPKLSDRSSVTSTAACIQSFVDSLLIPQFLWHRDSFELKVVPNPDIDNQWFLEGLMRVGDCVDDEWCAVWLLKEVSAKWDVVISVFDSDGDFLLIEAADALPSWVTPSNSENRVWIYSSHLHLIPLSHVSSPSRKRRHRLPRAQDSDDEDNIEQDENDDYLAVEDALALIRDSSVDTCAPREVEHLAWGRIGRYPEALNRHIHATNAYLPLDIAKALSMNSHLVQKAVEAFYTRDGVQLRAAHKMTRFPPDTSVLSTVHMTRTAYAQLNGQKFFPPKVFGRWTATPEGSKEWRWKDIGMKIAVGFEILFQETKRSEPAESAEIRDAAVRAKKDALQRDAEYKKYIQNLVSAGYFKGEIEGSQLWNVLEDRAVEMFIAVRKTDDHTRQSFASAVTSAICQAPESVLYVGNEDDDGWLAIDAEDFDDLLQKSVGRGSGDTPDRDKMDVDGSTETAEAKLASEQATRLQELASKVEQFVEGEGDMTGAIFEDEEFSDEEFNDDDMSSDSDEEDSSLDSRKRQEDMDKLVPELDPADYGQMPPSFHNKSQRLGPSADDEQVDEVSSEMPVNSPTSPPKSKPIRQPIIPRDKYDGVDSDDETDEEDPDIDSEDEENQPQVVGDVDVDMEEEEEEFLEFSRQALGISDNQWADMIKDRKERGAFVPKTVKTSSTKLPPDAYEPAHRPPEAGPRPNVNPNLDSFEAVMKAMDVELARSQNSNVSTQPKPVADKGKGKAKATTLEDVYEDEDIEAAMEAELKATLDGRDEEDEAPMDYNLIKNFLESFKGQGGLSGPVGNLAGRLQPGWTLPRDEA